jgi:hypothetical protein
MLSIPVKQLIEHRVGGPAAFGARPLPNVAAIFSNPVDVRSNSEYDSPRLLQGLLILCGAISWNETHAPFVLIEQEVWKKGNWTMVSDMRGPPSTKVSTDTFVQ